MYLEKYGRSSCGERPLTRMFSMGNVASTFLPDSALTVAAAASWGDENHNVGSDFSKPRKIEVLGDYRYIISFEFRLHSPRLPGPLS
ncbi:Uncharacterised protein [uncultured archaeon]|nr:Uncharacterised protein [uncultured archaeon]